ncbi:MAG: hypothetical protein B6I28_00765 [Fusobacteriia bacterium 4572_132]|nr:MAG: hypothetical protein B6I28_00765 [Fusobacteriia bacterium 4572_132]
MKNKRSMKNNLITTLIMFSAFLITVVMGLLYFYLNENVMNFNEGVLKTNKKVILNLFTTAKEKGKKIILDNNNKMINQTKSKIDKAMKESSKEANSSLLKLISQNLSSEFTMMELKMKIELNTPIFWWEKYSQEKEELEKIMKANKNYKGFIVYGEIIDPVLKVGKIEENYDIKKVLATTRKNKVYYSQVKNEGSFYIAYPIYNEEKAYKGFIIGEMKLEGLLSKVIDGIKLGSDRTIFVIKSNKMILKHKNKKYEGVRFTRAKYNSNKKFQQIIVRDSIYTLQKYQRENIILFIVVKEYIQDTFSNIESLKIESKEMINKSFASFNKKLEEEFNKSYAKIDTKGGIAVKNFAKNILQMVGIVFFIGILLSIMLGIILANKITKPVKELSYAAKKIARGELEYDLNKKLLERKDELGLLSREFNIMKNQLTDEMYKIKILERKKAQADRLTTMGQIVGGIVHEIKNPLASILGFSELIKEETEKKEIKEQSEIIISETNRLNKLVNELLEYSRPNKDFIKERIRIKMLIESVLDGLSPKIVKKQMNINVDIADSLPPIFGQKDKLIQVFINLISNSIEAMKRKDRTISIKAIRKNNDIVIRINDDGPGIEENIKDKMFLPFISNKKNGTGLGLSMVKKIIEDHDGEITLNEEVNEGTEFVIELPIGKKTM